MEFLQRFKMTNANKRPWIESDTIQLLEHKRVFADVNGTSFELTCIFIHVDKLFSNIVILIFKIS